MLKVGILGIGNAGNQVANLGFAEGIPSFCINTSEVDLNTINVDIPAFILGNSGGAGKDRNIAKRLVKANYKDFLSVSNFESFINTLDIVFIVASSGGGTGSGATIIISDILSRVYPNKLFIIVGILPSLNESVVAQKNTIEFFKEFRGRNCSYMLYDNNKYKNLSNSEMMEKINSEIIENTLYIRGDYSFLTKYGMIDNADMYKILSVPGMISITTKKGFFEKDLEEGEKLDNLIIKEIKNNASVPIDKDKIVKRLGVIVNIQESLSRFYDPAVTNFKAAVGEPLDMFEHYFVFDDDEQYINRIAIITSGLSLPDDRITSTIQRIQEVEEQFKKKSKASVLDSINSLDDFNVDSIIDYDVDNKDVKTDVSKLEIDFFDNY